MSRVFRPFGPGPSRAVTQRAVARAHHCRLAVETLHPRFRWVEPPYSIVLTVNSGYE
jgi:hypothetical protein